MAVVQMKAKINRPLMLLAAGFLWAGERLAHLATSVKPVPMKTKVRRNWWTMWFKKRTRATA